MRQLRGAPWESDRRELEKRAGIDQAFEVNHFLDRLPIGSPAPLIEFGFIGLAKIELHLCAFQAQQEPTLLLPDAHRMLIPANVAGGETVPQPAGGAADKFDVISRHSDFFVELAVGRVFEPLADAHTALRKLPTPAAGTASEKNIPLAAHQDDANVRAEAVCVNDVAHVSALVCHSEHAHHTLLYLCGMLSSRMAAWRGLAALVALAAAVFFTSLLLGSSGIGAGRVIAVLFGGGDDAARTVVTVVRLPRVLAAFGVGSLLAVSGVLLQALFRNPLADPYVLGVSGGAAVGALLAMIAGAAAVCVQSAATAGALGAVALVYFLARSGGTPRLLLTGVVVASACGAVVMVLLALADASRVRGMVFWLAGDLEWAFNPWTSTLAAVGAVVIAALFGRPLNVLAAGELRARSVGLELEVWRSLLFFACAVLTGIAIVSAGNVGFVGLITPHAVRLIFRTGDHRIVAPAAAVGGGTLLALADLVARTVASPRQLPVGAIMALVGAPLFIVLLRGKAR